jgi:hypothetical protein
MQRGHSAPEKRQRATIDPRPEPLKNSQIRIFGDSQYMCGWRPAKFSTGANLAPSRPDIAARAVSPLRNRTIQAPRSTLVTVPLMVTACSSVMTAAGEVKADAVISSECSDTSSKRQL